MFARHLRPCCALAVLALAGCGERASLPLTAGTGPEPELPAPQSQWIPTLHLAPAVGWARDEAPTPAPGTQVVAFASGLNHPRWLHVLPNGDVLVAETNAPPKPETRGGIRAWMMSWMKTKAGASTPSANRITLLRDTDGDGVADLYSVLIHGLNSPFGMALVGQELYVATTDALLRFPYVAGAMTIHEPGVPVLPLPAGEINHHWTRNLIAHADGQRLYVTVGSNSNVAESGLEVEQGRAAIWEVDTASGEHRVFASGLRNPNGMAWESASGALWTVVDEREGLGSDLVPDYLTSVQDGGFYGWPFSYFGHHVDPRVQPPQPERVAQALVPDYALGPHTASLGLASSVSSGLPAPFVNGMFVGQHGSWNRRPHSGYKVVHVAFVDGKPSGEPVDVLSNFLNADGDARGRPVGVALDLDGALLVADDVGEMVWRVSAAAPQSDAPPAAVATMPASAAARPSR